MSDVKFVITGYEGCSYYNRAVQVGQNLSQNHNGVNIETICLPRSEFKAKLSDWRQGLEDKAQSHGTSPFIWREQNGDRKSVV